MTNNSPTIKNYFPGLIEPELQRMIEKVGVVKEYQPDETIMEIGSFIKSVPLLLTGVIKIIREDEEGNEIFLYYLTTGQTCAMSLTCCMADSRSQIRAVAEEASKLLMIPSHMMDEWMVKFPSWRKFVMQNYHERFHELLGTIDSIAFLNLEERLIRYLEDRAEHTGSREIKATHQEIARKLNSTRVVISRLLKQLEKQGLIRLGRNTIVLN